MLLRNFLTVVLATCVTVKTEPKNDNCDISSDFVSSLFSGLVSFYKYQDVATASALITRAYKRVYEFEKLFDVAVNSRNYNNFKFRFQYFTESVREDMTLALNQVNQMAADSDDKIVKQVAKYIKDENFEGAASEMSFFVNDILTYKIIEVAYKAEKHVIAFQRLLKFCYHLLEIEMIDLAVIVEVAFFKELSQDTKNFYTREMVTFAQLVRETIELYYEFFRDTPKYFEMHKKLRFIQISLPEQIQRLVFLKGFLFTNFLCFRNVYWKERMFVGDFQYGNDHNRRILYTASENVALANQQWNVYYNSTKQGYILRSALYDEYLHNAEDAIEFDENNRFVFTKPKKTDPLKGYWAFVPFDTRSFAIKNLYDNEFIYAFKDATFVKENHKRRVFSWKLKGEFKSQQVHSDLWTLEAC